VAEYVVGRRVTRYETVRVAAASPARAVEAARRAARFVAEGEETEHDVFELPDEARGAAGRRPL
jgi:hypothetical protein